MYQNSLRRSEREEKREQENVYMRNMKINATAPLLLSAGKKWFSILEVRER